MQERFRRAPRGGALPAQLCVSKFPRFRSERQPMLREISFGFGLLDSFSQ